MASEKVLQTKKQRVSELAELIKAAKSGALVDYQGVTVEEDTKLRRDMRENNVHYFVEKNTMLRLAFKEAGIEGLDDVLNGATALALSNDDETAPARLLGKYADEFENKFSLKAGFIGTTVYDQAGVVALSKIPGKETLLAQLVGSLQGPLTKLAATLKAVADKKNEEAA
ncbi:MAG: 50S ribosomal protein L10 [Ruminococcus sp.]|nr:50S ribosomal protein L10 [Ruminococcus sp.]MCR5141971.1 50S ribosomal protein L10 [Ruminococcus sp.]